MVHLSRRTVVGGAATTGTLAATGMLSASSASADVLYTIPKPAGAVNVKSMWAPNLVTMSTMDEHVARRFSCAPRPDVYLAARGMGWTTWLTRQMAMTKKDEQVFLDQLTKWLPLATKSWAECDALTKSVGLSWSGVPQLAGAMQRRGVQVLRQMMSPRQVNESLAEFWLDHFSIPYVDKASQYVYDTDQVVREVALTTVPNVIKTIYSYPFIHFYLDNNLNRKAGPNENLARETMELYLLGSKSPATGKVNYTEADVKQLAILLTGFTGHVESQPKVIFDAGQHLMTADPLVIRGRTYANSNATEALASWDKFLTDTLNDTACRAFICTKLARRYVSDKPSATLINQMTYNWSQTGGDIKQLIWTMVRSVDFANAMGQKVKRPNEYLAGMVGARKPVWVEPEINPWFKSMPETQGHLFTNIQYIPLPRYRSIAALAGHELRTWPTPDGFKDVGSWWLSTNALLMGVRSALVTGDIEPELKSTQSWAQALGLSALPDDQLAIKIVRHLTGFMPDQQLMGVLVPALAAQTTLDAKAAVGVEITLTHPLAFLR